MSLLQMSVSGAMIIGVIVCVRATALYRLPKNILLFLWGIALTRLLLPYSLPCVYSICSLLERYQHLRFSVRTANHYNALMISTVTTPQNTTAPSVSSPAAMEIFRMNIDYFSLIKIIWLIGICIGAVFFAAAYFQCRWKFREALPLDKDSESNLYIQNWLAEKKNQRLCFRRSITVRKFDRISTPLTYGIFHPVILLPARHQAWTDKTALDYILTHEYTHIYYYDAVLKLILIIALCIHWFNPMVWVLYILANRDIELRCDEAVIRLSDGKKKSDYAMTLILMAEQNSSFQPLCSRFSKWCLFGRNNKTHAMRVMEERITAIMKMKKLSLRTGIIGAVLSVSITTAFATSALPEQLKPDDAKQNYNIQVDKDNVFISESPAKASDFKEYEPFGLKFDEKTKILSYQNKRVRYFYDGAKIGDNCSVTRLEYADAEQKGDIDIHTIRQREENGDGSYTVLGKLTGLEIDAKEVFENRHFVSADFAITSVATSDVSTSSMVEKEFSGEEVCETATDKQDDIIVTIHGNPESTALAVSEEDIVNYTVTADPTTASAISEEDIVDYTVTTDNVTNVNAESTGMTLEEKFQQYEKYGIRYEASTNGSAGNVYYNNQLVRSFADISPTGSAFSFTTEAKSDIRVQTVYDENGNLTGVKQMD